MQLSILRVTHEEMSSDSSEEDEINKFREAVDGEFLTEDLYNTNDLKKKNESPQKPPPSLRNTNHETVSFNPFSIKVTPEFQNYVSQHLSRLMDKSIDDSKTFLKIRKFKNNKGTGVKLLHTSKDYLVSHKIIEVPRKHVRRRDSESEDYEKRAKEVAVTAEWVLSKKEIEHWAPNMKGEIEVIKMCAQKKRKRKSKKKVNSNVVL